jgi:hypothetical protein
LAALAKALLEKMRFGPSSGQGRGLARSSRGNQLLELRLAEWQHPAEVPARVHYEVQEDSQGLRHVEEPFVFDYVGVNLQVLQDAIHASEVEQRSGDEDCAEHQLQVSKSFLEARTIGSKVGQYAKHSEEAQLQKMSAITQVLPNSCIDPNDIMLAQSDLRKKHAISLIKKACATHGGGMHLPEALISKPRSI